MSDLISRADAIAAVCDNCGSEKYCDRSCQNICVIPVALSALPTADRPQGVWKQTVTGQPYCSACEYVYGEDEEFDQFWNFCPNCGAEMKEKE